jgi:hypothetical protein
MTGWRLDVRQEGSPRPGHATGGLLMLADGIVGSRGEKRCPSLWYNTLSDHLNIDSLPYNGSSMDWIVSSNASIGNFNKQGSYLISRNNLSCSVVLRHARTKSCGGIGPSTSPSSSSSRLLEKGLTRMRLIIITSPCTITLSFGISALVVLSKYRDSPSGTKFSSWATRSINGRICGGACMLCVHWPANTVRVIDACSVSFKSCLCCSRGLVDGDNRNKQTPGR